MQIKRPNVNRRSQRRGISLVEVVIASALLATGIIPILHALTAAQTNTRRIETLSRSLVFAQTQLEKMHAEAERDYHQSFAVTSKSIGDGYLLTIQDNAHANLRRVKVIVGFDTNEDGRLSTKEQQVTLSSYLACRD